MTAGKRDKLQSPGGSVARWRDIVVMGRGVSEGRSQQEGWETWP